MSVAAMTLDDQRLNSYVKMPKQYVGVESPDSPQYHHHHHPIQPQQQRQESHQQQHQHQLSAEQRMLEEEIEGLKAEQERLIQQCADTQRREKILTRRLANKEQEFQDYVTQIAEYKAAQVPSALALRSALLDPAVNLLFEKLKKELKATKAKLEETQNELSAWKFTPDSNTGKRLMAKCRLLYQENEELGKMTSSGRLAKLETDLAMQKSFSEEVKKSQSELDDFLQELDEDVEGMQSTILFLQQELKTTRERIQELEKENFQLKNGIIGGETLSHANSGEMSRKNINEQIDNENNVEIHAGLNGKSVAAIAKGNVIVETDSQRCYQQKNEQQNEMDMQAINAKSRELIMLAPPPVKEEPCVRVSAYTCGNIVHPIDFYNGMATGDGRQNVITHADDIASGSKMSRPTATITRKRGYDSSGCNEIITESTIITSIPSIPLQVTHVAPTPRTLPPKKSKLRISAPLMVSHESLVEINENENLTSVIINDISSNATTITTPMSVVDHTMIRDSMANDEAQMSAPIEDCPNIGVAQRIMTRRRSMRTQQNGV